MARKPPGKRFYGPDEKSEQDKYWTEQDRKDRERQVREQEREQSTERIYQARHSSEYKRHYDIYLSTYAPFGGTKEPYQGLLDDADSYALGKIGIKYHNPGHKHLTGGVSQKAQRAYEHIKASLSGPRRKEIATRTVRKMISEGKINPPEYLEADSAYNAGELMAEMYNSIRVRPGRETFLSGFNKWFNKWKKMGVTGSKANAQQSFEAGFRAKYRLSNPSEAEEISEGFHGRKISEVLEVEEEELIPDNTAVLGCLLDITVTRDNGKTGIPIIFLRDGQKPKRGEEVYVCAPDRHNLEFVGGDQEIKGIEKLCGCDHSKQFVKLGFVESLAYLADKHHLEGSNGREEPYEHEFGKKKWMGFGKKYGRPELIYDTRNCKISLVGGTYTIEDEGITN